MWVHRGCNNAVTTDCHVVCVCIKLKIEYCKKYCNSIAIVLQYWLGEKYCNQYCNTFSTKYCYHCYQLLLQYFLPVLLTTLVPPLQLLSVSTLQCESKKIPWGFLAFSPKQLGIFWSNFTRLLYVPIYATLQIFIQLSATLMKLCHIARDHPVRIICANCSTMAKTHSGIFCHFFPNIWEFVVQTLLAYYTFPSTLDYKFLFNYRRRQLWRSYAILNATTQRAFRPMVDILRIMVVALNMA